MENEEENKKAGTQTAAEETSTDANNKNTEQSAEENNSGADIANAFGNKESNAGDNQKKDDSATGTEDKTEKKGGSKANSVAKQNEDGSITFKNQEELEGFINKIYAKGATKAESNNNETNDSKSDEDAEGKEQKNKSDNSAVDQDKKEQDDTVEQVRDYTDSIALALVEADINPKRARAASRLIDTSKVVINGVLDEAKLQEEINNLVSEWPELKNTAAQNKQEKGFKFGGEGQQEENLEEDQIAQIFGNKSDN